MVVAQPNALKTRVRRTNAWVVAACMCAALSISALGNVTMTVEQFGSLRAFRPGDMTGVCVRIHNDQKEPLECLVEWDLENADGDVIANTRPITLTPQQTMERWVYARLPPSPFAESLADTVYTLRLFESRGSTRVREIAKLNFRPNELSQPSMPVALREGLIAVIGESRMGLETLEATHGGNAVPSMQEVTRISRGIRPSELPDRWEGFSSASVILWAGVTGPQSLAPDRAAALLEWIKRGGHFVIVLPEATDSWGLRSGSGHPLSTLLPTEGVQTVDGLRVASVMPALAKGGVLRNSNATMRATLFDPAKLNRGWNPLVWIPPSTDTDTVSRTVQGFAMVAQRLWGHGRVSLVGVDVEGLHRQSLLPDGLPQADVFWNAVLGARADAPTEDNYRIWEEQKPPQLAPQQDPESFSAGDGSLILNRIGLMSHATSGVLMVIVFFVVYWVAAVPISSFLLRKSNRLKWSWPVFAFAAVVACGVAGLLGFLLEPQGPQVRHVSVVDWIVPTKDDGLENRDRTLRVQSWFSAALGGFGTATLELGDRNDHSNVLSDWSPPPNGNAQRFPDTARSERSVDEANTLRIPSRGTTTEVQAQWIGSPPEPWGKVAWQDEQYPVKAIVYPSAEPRVGLQGVLRHSLPAPLHDVILVHVQPMLSPHRMWSAARFREITPTALPPRPARMVGLVGPWDGSGLDLARALYPKGSVIASNAGEGSLVTELQNLYCEPLLAMANEGLARGSQRNPFEPDAWKKQLCMLSLFHMLQPPAYRANPPKDPLVVRVQRMLGRDLDLSPWFTRPCVIVMGFLHESQCPLSLRIDGDVPDSNGNVMVRFIVPLPCVDAGAVPPVTASNVVP